MIIDGININGTSDGVWGSHATSSTCLKWTSSLWTLYNATYHNIATTGCVIGTEIFGGNAIENIAIVDVSSEWVTRGIEFSEPTSSTDIKNLYIYNSTLSWLSVGISTQNSVGEFDSSSATIMYNRIYNNSVWVDTDISWAVADTNIFCNNTSDGYTGTNALTCWDSFYWWNITYTKYDKTLQFNSIVDAGSNPYITWYTETDPIRLSEKSDYATTGSVSAVTLTNGNGITIDWSNNIDLGGNLNQATTTINVGSNEMYINSNNSEVYVADWRVYLATANYKPYLDLYTNYAAFGRDLGTTSNRYFANATDMYIQGGFAGFEGLQYFSDYSANYNSRSLTDVAYVTGEVANPTANVAINTGNYIFFGSPDAIWSARIGLSGTDLCTRIYSGGSATYEVSSCDTL